MCVRVNDGDAHWYTEFRGVERGSLQGDSGTRVRESGQGGDGS